MSASMMIESLEGRRLCSASFLAGIGGGSPTTAFEGTVVVAKSQPSPPPPPPPIKIVLADVLISSYQ